MDLGLPQTISGILTQGSPREERWVTNFAVSYSLDGRNFFVVKEADGKAAMFIGNVDQKSVVKNMFDSQILARYVRVVVIEAGSGGSGLRFNLLGCSSETTKTSPQVTPIPTATPRPVSTIEPSKYPKEGRLLGFDTSAELSLNRMIFSVTINLQGLLFRCPQ